MWWQMAAQAGLSLLQAQGAKAVNKYNNRIAASNNKLAEADAKNKNNVRAAANINAAAQGGLARWVQSVNNNRRLDEGGRALEENTVNFYRQADALQGQSLAQDITNAEQAGVMAVSAAAAGVDGQVVDMVNSSTALRNSIVAEHADRLKGAYSYDTARRAGLIMSQTVSSLDNSLIFDNLDYNVDVAQRQVDNRTTPSYFSAILGSALKTLPAALGTMGSAQGAAAGAASAYALPTTGVKFGFKMPAADSTFSLGSTPLGVTESFKTDSIYSLTSR